MPSRSPAPSRRIEMPWCVSMMKGVASGMRSKGNGAVMNFERRSGRTGTSIPASRPTPSDHAPAARTTTGASIAPADVVTPSTRVALRRTPVTSVPVRISTPSSRARAAIAVVTRYGSA